MTVDHETFRATMGYWASGVSLVTSSDHEILAGLTVSAFASLSLTPPLVLVGINRQSSSLEIILRVRRFAVNILSEAHEDLSRRFATRHALDKFAGVRWCRMATGAPILDSALAWLDCELETCYDGGDHVILIGLVQAASVAAPDRAPLLYYCRGYQQLRWCAEPAGTGAAATPSADTDLPAGLPQGNRKRRIYAPRIALTAHRGRQRRFRRLRPLFHRQGRVGA